MDAHRAEKRIQRNYIVKIHTLPVELLVDILHASLPLDEYGSKKYYPRLLALTRVSDRWRAVIQSTPWLWSIIGDGHHPKANSLALLKSKKHRRSAFPRGPEIKVWRMWWRNPASRLPAGRQ